MSLTPPYLSATGLSSIVPAAEVAEAATSVDGSSTNTPTFAKATLAAQNLTIPITGATSIAALETLTLTLTKILPAPQTDAFRCLKSMVQHSFH